MHQPAYRGAQIVVADNNSPVARAAKARCGDEGMGVRCVIAPSFGPIFSTLLPEWCAADPAATSEVLAIARNSKRRRAGQQQRAAAGHRPATRTVTTQAAARSASTSTASAAMPAQGLNEVALTLAREDEIAAHQAKARARTPWLYPTN